MAFLEWFLDFKNGPPFLSFGGFQKRVAIFFIVFGSLLERGTRDKNKNAIFVFVFDVPIGTTSEVKINSNADYKFISDEGLYSRRAIFLIGPTIDVDHNACCGIFSHVQTVIVISSAGWEQRQPASFQKSATAGAIPLEEHCFNFRYPIEH